MLTKRSRRTVAYLNARSCDRGVEPAIVERVRNFESAAFFNGLIYAGDLAVVIDGLNEVSPEVRAQIVAFANRIGQANVIIATQPIEGIGGARSPLTLAVPYELLPLARDDIAAFLKSRPARDNPANRVGAKTTTAPSTPCLQRRLMAHRKPNASARQRKFWGRVTRHTSFSPIRWI